MAYFRCSHVRRLVDAVGQAAHDTDPLSGHRACEVTGDIARALRASTGANDGDTRIL